MTDEPDTPAIDATEIGVVAARVMEDIDGDVKRGRLGDSPRVIAALVVYEVRYIDEDGNPTSMVGCRVTDDRNVVALGLNARAHQALVDPYEDIGS